MMKYRIRYTQDAIDDLDAIFDYIAVENQDAALKMLSRFNKSIGRLADAPYIGAAIPNDGPSLVAEGYRYVVVLPYLVFYRIEAGEVRIGRVLHSRQDWLHLLFQSGRAKPPEAERRITVGPDEDE